MTPREFSHTDKMVQLTAIFTHWLPLATTVLKMVCSILPSPLDVSSDRIERLMTSNNNNSFNSLLTESQQLKKGIVVVVIVVVIVIVVYSRVALLSCSSSSNAPLIVFVSKLFPIDAQSLPKHRGKLVTIIHPLTTPTDHTHLIIGC